MSEIASANANLSDLRTAAICVTAFAGFLRFNELAIQYNTIQYNVLYFERVDIHD